MCRRKARGINIGCHNFIDHFLQNSPFKTKSDPKFVQTGAVEAQSASRASTTPPPPNKVLCVQGPPSCGRREGIVGVEAQSARSACTTPPSNKVLWVRGPGVVGRERVLWAERECCGRRDKCGRLEGFRWGGIKFLILSPNETCESRRVGVVILSQIRVYNRFKICKEGFLVRLCFILRLSCMGFLMKTYYVAFRTTHDADAHSALKRCARGLECTQHSVHSKS